MDMEIDDIWAEKKGRKKIKSKTKGKRVELELVHDLNRRFDTLLGKNSKWGKFSRTVGSGNRWGQKVQLSQHATQTYSGDITCPENFRFVIESKGGYNDIDICSLFGKGNKELDSFLQQVTDDSERSGRDPMLIWKKDRKPRLVFLKTKELSKIKVNCKLCYKDWTAVSFDDVFGLKDEFFFNQLQ